MVPSARQPHFRETGMSTNDPSWPSDDSGATPPPPASSGGGGGASLDLAPFGERAIAFLIDFAIFLAIGLVVQLFIGFISDVLASLVTFVLSIGLGIAVFVLGEGGPLGQTPGKHMRGIKVVKEDGSQLGTSGGVIRWLGRILDTIVCGLPIGYLWPLFDDQERTWHDLVASTRVINGGDQGSVTDWFGKFRG